MRAVFRHRLAIMWWSYGVWRRAVLYSLTGISLSLQRRYSPGWASASFKSFLHLSWFTATILQFLHPSLATSSSTPSSQRNSGALSSWLTEEDSPGLIIVVLAYDMSCPSQFTQLAEFHNVILNTQLVEFLVSYNSPTSPVHHWAINSPEDFTLEDTKTMSLCVSILLFLGLNTGVLISP